MKGLPLAEVKADLSRIVDRVEDTDEQVIITRNGRPAAVLVSPDEYEREGDRQLHPDPKRKVRAGLDLIRTQADAGKALRDDLTGLGSLRVGRFRIVYRNSPRLIELVAIGPRRTIYQETLRALRRNG